MAGACGCVAFVTDFGTDDTYAGALVGSCWRVDRRLRCAAATHGVPPGDVLAGAYHLKAAALAFPDGTVFCAVVDPGVGTERRAIAVDVGRVRCVGPDNGLVTYLWEEAAPEHRRCVALPVPDAASATFHGRDVFAPVAARLAAGAALDECGVPAGDPQRLGAALARVDGDVARCRVAVVDRFGNAITTLRVGDVGGRCVLGARWEGGGCDRVVRTYAEIDEGVALLVGSAGHWEIAARSAPATALGGPGRGALVEVLLG